MSDSVATIVVDPDESSIVVLESVWLVTIVSLSSVVEGSVLVVLGVLVVLVVLGSVVGDGVVLAELVDMLPVDDPSSVSLG